MTLAHLKIADFLKPTAESRVGVLQSSLSRLKSVPGAYRDSIQVRRWARITLLSIARALGDRGDGAQAMAALGDAVADAEAVDRRERSQVSAIDLIESIQAAEKVRTEIQPPIPSDPRWASLLTQTCTRLGRELRWRQDQLNTCAGK
jgi:hypothetical protein